MIICHSKKFVFIKGRKIASTSIEVALSGFCQSIDILTPMTPIDDVLRYQRTGLTAQNYGADEKKIEKYRNKIISFVSKAPEDWSAIRKPRGEYNGHMAFKDIEQVHGEFSKDWMVIAICRNPYEQALSRIKHMASKAAIQQRSSDVLDVQSVELEAAKKKFCRKAKEKSLCLNIDLYKDKFGKMRPTFILRYEKLNDDFLTLSKLLGNASPLPLTHLKKSKTSEHLDPEKFFREDEIRMINECFNEEFVEFGYDKLE